MIVETMQVCDLLDDEADAIVAHLTNAGSEFREEVATRKTKDHRTPISLVIEEGTLVAWACSHQWRGMQTLEMFTSESQRRRRLATIATTVLVASSQFDFSERRVVVFHPSSIAIARAAGCSDVVLYGRGADGEWVMKT